MFAVGGDVVIGGDNPVTQFDFERRGSSMATGGNAV